MIRDDVPYRLVPATAEVIRGRSRGAITRNPVAYDLNLRERSGKRIFEPEPGGFYCERLFGPVAKRDPAAFAHIELGVVIRHPLHNSELSALPVLPAAYRTPTSARDGVQIDDITQIYGFVYHACRGASRLRELRAPAEMISVEVSRAEHYIARLFDNHLAASPLVRRDGTPLDSLASKLATENLDELAALVFALCFEIVAASS